MDYTTLFTPHMREKPKFMALASAVLAQVYDLITLIPSLGSGFSFAAAEGVQLDALAGSVSLPRRPGWDDETLRAFLLKKLAVYSWKGTNDTVDEVLAGQTGAMVSDNCDGTVNISPADGVFPVPAGIRAVASP
ncbi:MAG: hypothetical protein IKQ45_05065 [Clostridia bacterium]|nr:hypothetical protein [Clostridia bacterium]